MAFVVAGRVALKAGRLAFKHRDLLRQLVRFRKPMQDLAGRVSKLLSAKDDGGKLGRQACLEELQRCSAFPKDGGGGAGRAQEVCDLAFNVVAQTKGDSIHAEELLLAAYVSSAEDDELEVQLGKGFDLMDAGDRGVIDRDQGATIFRAISGDVKEGAVIADKVFKTPEKELSREDFVQGCLGHQDIRDRLSKVKDKVKGKGKVKGKEAASAGASKR